MSDSPGRRWLGEEVVQSSAMDCGPAALKSLLGGFGISVSYGRLREACQTDVDGTSIDTLEALANQLGLSAEQVLLPADFLELPEAAALPAIAVVRQPRGDTHFMVLWRRHGPLVQVMDPASGRRWLSWQKLHELLYQHEAEVSLEAWQQWATSEGFLAVLRARLQRLGIDGTRLIEDACKSSGATELCTLDAAVRALTALIRAGAIDRGDTARRFLDAQLHAAANGRTALAEEWFAARPLPVAAGQPTQVRIRGAVLVRAIGRRDRSAVESAEKAEALSPLLRAALNEPSSRPLRELAALLGAGRWSALAWMLTGTLLYGVGVTSEAVLLRSLLDIGPRLGLWTQRLVFAVMTLLLGAGLFLLDGALQAQVLRLGRQLETRLRLALLQKVPRLEDRYFHSRPLSDMAERAHQLHLVREVPVLVFHLLRAGAQILTTTAALLWLDPSGGRWTLLLGACGLGLPLVFLPLLQERDLRVRSHQGALASFFFDALRGLIPLRAHGAGPAVRVEQEGLLAEWARARGDLTGTVTALVGLTPLVGLVLLGLLWLGLAERKHEVGTVLLLVYWSLSLSSYGQQLALSVRQYPTLRSTLLRLLEPLRAKTQQVAAAVKAPALSPAATGAAVRLVDVALTLAGRPVLTGVHLDLPAASHVAIVGRSGAGKSSLLGLLLGFYAPASGLLEVDGRSLGPAEVAALRQATAWLDPQVQLWNRSLLENLCYGTPGAPSDLEPLLASASLRGLLARLPAGLATRLGESGACVSGGEGQRVRLGRALLRQDARLLLLDEPFRGLDRGQRAALLARTRAAFSAATLLCVTHDVGDTLSFPRVLVIEDGRIVEDGIPAELRARPGSRYQALLQAEETARRSVWEAPVWRRLRLEGGKLLEAAPSPAQSPSKAVSAP